MKISMPQKINTVGFSGVAISHSHTHQRADNRWDRSGPTPSILI